MAYALVKAGTVATGVTSVSPTFGQTTAANDLLVALLANSSSGVNLNTPAGWTRVVNFAANAAIFYKVAAGSDAAPTFTDSNSGFMACVLLEFSGNATTSPEDLSANNFTGTTPNSTANASADAAAGELVVAVQLDLLSKTGTTTTTHTYNNGASANSVGNNDATSTQLHYRLSWGITTGNSVADSVSFADGSMNLSSIQGAIASFKLASSGPAYALTPSYVLNQAVNRSAVF